MRILQEFFESIGKVMRRTSDIEDPDTSHLQERFYEMYRQFFRTDADHFYETDKEIILEDLENEGRSEEDNYAKAQMLSELLYRDALIKKSVQERCDLLDKSLHLLEYLNANTRTFSWERNQRIADIKKMLNEYEI